MGLEIYLLRSYLRIGDPRKVVYKLERQKVSEFPFQLVYDIYFSLENCMPDTFTRMIRARSRIQDLRNLYSPERNRLSYPYIDFEIIDENELFSVASRSIGGKDIKFATIINQFGCVAEFKFPNAELIEEYKQASVLRWADQTLLGVWELKGKKFEFWALHFRSLAQSIPLEIPYSSTIAPFSWPRNHLECTYPICCFDELNSRLYYLVFCDTATNDLCPIQIGIIHYTIEAGYSNPQLLKTYRTGTESDTTYHLKYRPVGLCLSRQVNQILLVLPENHRGDRVFITLRAVSPRLQSLDCSLITELRHRVTLPTNIASLAFSTSFVRFSKVRKMDLIIVEICDAAVAIDTQTVLMIVFGYCRARFTCLSTHGIQKGIMKEAAFGYRFRCLNNTEPTVWWAKPTSDRNWMLTRVRYQLK